MIWRSNYELTVLHQLCLAKVGTSMLILSGADDIESEIRGFGFGADY